MEIYFQVKRDIKSKRKARNDNLAGEHFYSSQGVEREPGREKQ